MAAEFIVAGRKPLPGHTKPWEMTLENEEGGVWVYECVVAFSEPERVVAEVSQIVGWKPEVVVMVRKAWDLAQVVAEELATMLEGVVFSDVDDVVFFDAEDEAKGVSAIDALEARLRHAFNHPEPFFATWQEEEERRVAAEGPAIDWSDL